ncbi:ATP-BINDING CASSETTE SUB-FAMILY C [Salix purpurea]|uniref:ATP-BINDING CASSETTE SUB-FAMILY C n=1 Tax=Salix purpurea TaxID=77065 RepID=A0A9Q1A0L0_SALPP|nr:ATP-BINDING CASSETTE SUB-FAMILY C [Salix purpurea]
MKFLSEILELRQAETGWLRKYVYKPAMISYVFWGGLLVWWLWPLLVLLIGIPLESGKVLSALATFRILQVPIYNLPDSISMIVQTKVSLDRIASFISLDDLKNDVLEKLPRGSSDTAVEIVDGNFSNQ